MINYDDQIRDRSSILLVTEDDTGVFSPWSLVHFSSGAVASRYVRLEVWILIHQLWEIMEQTPLVSGLFRHMGYPEYSGDTAVNSAGDTLSTLMGYVVGTSITNKHSSLASPVTNSTPLLVAWVLEALFLCLFAAALCHQINYAPSSIIVLVLFMSMMLWVMYTDCPYDNLLSKVV